MWINNTGANGALFGLKVKLKEGGEAREYKFPDYFFVSARWHGSTAYAT
jgi:hypothetical protein